MRGKVRRGRRQRLCVGPWRKEEDSGAEEPLAIHARADSRSRNSGLRGRSKRGSLAAQATHSSCSLHHSNAPSLRYRYPIIPPFSAIVLAPGGTDHGCDVVVLNLGVEHENLLIQCKSTSRDDLDSEVAVREIVGARPYYEKALGVTFNRRCLHTTAKNFSRRTRRAAELCGVTLCGRSWLADTLTKAQIDQSAILLADTKRERIG